jgi:hypothetical protein
MVNTDPKIAAVIIAIRTGRRLPTSSARLVDEELQQDGVDLVGGEPTWCGPPFSAPTVT